MAETCSSCNSFNTQPPEGGWAPSLGRFPLPSCFNTQPPEGGWTKSAITLVFMVGFNTQPPEGGWIAPPLPCKGCPMFQHTAARRRLGGSQYKTAPFT